MLGDISMLDVGKWLKVFDYKNLDNFLKSEKGKGGIGEALTRVIVAFLIYQIPITIIAVISVLILGTTAAATYGGNGSTSGVLGGLIAGGGIVLIIVFFFASLILAPILFLIGTGVLHVISGLLGGKGTFSNFAYLSSFVAAASYLIGLVLDIIPSLLGLIPGMVGTTLTTLVSCVLAPIGFVAWLYLLFVTYKAIMINYGLSSGRAIASIVLNIIFWVVVAVVLMVIAMLLFGATLASLGVLAGSGSSGFGSALGA